jgi:hypothetical protein
MYSRIYYCAYPNVFMSVNNFLLLKRSTILTPKKQTFFFVYVCKTRRFSYLLYEYDVHIAYNIIRIIIHNKCSPKKA